MSNTPVSPGLTNFATINGHRYRLAGLVRGASSGASDIADADVVNALVVLGFANLVYYPTGSALPSDWPAESLPPASTDERVFRAEGTWTSSSPMTTSVSVGNGLVTTFQIWDFVRDSVSSDNSSNLVPVSAISTSMVTGGTDRALLASGIVFVGVGVLAAFAVWRNRTKENPVRYDTSIDYRGVPVHVHREDVDGESTYCADYRAVEIAAPGKGGTVCAPDKFEAINQAKKRIDALVLQNPKRKRRRKARAKK